MRDSRSEDADRIGSTHHGVGVGVVGGKLCEVDLDALVAANQGDRLLECGEHAEAEQVDLDDAQVRAVVLIPLHYASARHRGGLDRNDFVEAARGDHDPAAVLAEMTGQALDGTDQLDPMAYLRRLGVELGFA